MGKRDRKINFLLLLVIILFLTKGIFALGVIPGKMAFDFHPGLNTQIEYHVIEDDPSKELKIFADGPLAEYVKVSKDKLVGSGSFTVTLNLPEKIETPGENKIYIRVQEKVDDELVDGVGTAVGIGALLVINVPYPGMFLEISLGSENANVGEPVNFILGITNKGTEAVDIQPRIEITSSDELVDTLYFNEREVNSQEEIKLKKTLDTTDYNPGLYKATAVVDYGGKTAKAESDFKIGELIINLVNYTKKMTIGGIRAFEIGIESGWNNNIDGAYAEVSVYNGLQTLASFKTETTQLTSWEAKTIKGYLDTRNFTKGIYDANITLFYYGKDQGKSTSETVKVEFVEGINKILIALIIAGIVLVAGIIVVRKYFWKKNKKKSKRRK